MKSTRAVQFLIFAVLSFGLAACKRTSIECALDPDEKSALQESRPLLAYFKNDAPCYQPRKDDFVRKAKASEKKGDFVKIHYSLADLAYAQFSGRIFSDVSPASLPYGKTFNYIINAQGEWVFGMVVDAWEIGVKHLTLAEKNRVLAAGELKIEENGDFQFNLNSGSITLPILQKHPEYREELYSTIAQIFEMEMQNRTGNLVRENTSLLPTNLPTVEEKGSACSKSSFKLRNQAICGG